MDRRLGTSTIRRFDRLRTLAGVLSPRFQLTQIRYFVGHEVKLQYSSKTTRSLQNCGFLAITARFGASTLPLAISQLSAAAFSSHYSRLALPTQQTSSHFLPCGAQKTKEMSSPLKTSLNRFFL